MDNIREKLVKILVEPCCGLYPASELADYLIEQGVTVQEWIPVTERLPDVSGKYLVTGRSFRERIPQIWICEFINCGLLRGWSNEARNPIVEAWMPLPTPPKGE